MKIAAPVSFAGTSPSCLAGLACVVVGLALPTPAFAAPDYVDRRQTLPPVTFAFDLGLGVGHYDRGSVFGAGRDGTGAGTNLELSIGIIRHLELGFRHGIRFGDEGRIAGADRYGRLYDWKTFATGDRPFTNPEARIRGQLVDLEVVELSLEGRLVLPFVPTTRVGAMFGVPLSFHLGRIARIDTGGYVAVQFYDRTPNSLILPIDVWFQLTHRFWLGPQTGVVLDNPGSNTRVPLGMGLGYQFASWGDFKAGFLFPAIDRGEGTSNFGLGAGVQLRIE